MNTPRFKRLKHFLRWFFNVSPDWSESRAHAIETNAMRLPEAGRKDAKRTTSPDSPKFGSAPGKRRKNRPY